MSQVPDEAGPIVRALLTADKNQRHTRARMTDEQRAATPEVDFRPFIIADADTGHGGDAHVRNLVRRFVEVGVPGYHIEDQKVGVKKCGHQGGKVLVTEDEQIKRLNAARFQFDVMGVPGLIVARTDAESATLLDGRGDERDQPFILGVTNLGLPSFRTTLLAMLRQFHRAGVAELSGHLLYAMADEEYASADPWLEKHGLVAIIREAASQFLARSLKSVDDALDKAFDKLFDAWQEEAGVKTYAEAVADAMRFRISEGEQFPITPEEWLAFANHTGWFAARAKARGMGLEVTWDCEHAKTPDGYYQVRGGIEYAIAKSLAVAPFCDLLWMETKTADLHEAQQVRRGDSREVPRQDAGLQPLAVVQLGHHRHERRADARLPGRAGQAGLRVQLHHLRRPPDRRPGGRGVRHRAAPGRHAGPGPAAAEVPPAGVALPHAADAGGRPPRRTRASCRSPGAPRPPGPWARARRSSSTWCRPRCRRGCSRSGWSCGASSTAWT